MRKFKMSVNGNWYEIEIKDLKESPISVLVDGELYRVELAHEPPDTKAVESVSQDTVALVSEPSVKARKPALRQAQDTAVAGGEVIAPMPGKILAINVGEGDRVQHKEVLCILEAMKMENEIMASAGGGVKEIRVTEGQDVLYGDVLFVME